MILSFKTLFKDLLFVVYVLIRFIRKLKNSFKQRIRNQNDSLTILSITILHRVSVITQHRLAYANVRGYF